MINEQTERILVWLIALHSAIVGIMLMFFADWSIAFAGWSHAEPLFFVHQGGIFHVVLAIGYVAEYKQRRGVSLLIIAKSCAFVFLLVESLIVHAPWVVPFSGVTDGAMGLLVVWMHRQIRSRS